MRCFTIKTPMIARRYTYIKTAHSNGAMGQAAAARAARPAHGHARHTRPCAALGRGEKHVAATAAGADNMMHSIPNVYFDEQHFYMGKSLPTAAQSPRSVRPVPSGACATYGRAGCTLSSP